jgi:hypothetical protein
LAPVASAGYDGGYAMNADVIKTSRLNGLHAKRRLQPSELVWVPGTTEGNNLVASAWARPRLRTGDELRLTVASAHLKDRVVQVP